MAIQSRYGRVRPSPARLVIVRVHLPSLSANSTDEQEQELEERANALKQSMEGYASRCLTDIIGEDYANSGYSFDAKVVH